MKTSSRPGAGDVTSGADARMPPSGSQPLQLVPSKKRCQSCRSWPRISTSIRLGPQDTAPGSAVMIPPSDCHPAQLVPSKLRCQSALSCPRMKTSSRLLLHDDASGPDERMPPSDSHWLTPIPVSDADCGVSAALSVRVTAPVLVPDAVGVKLTYMVQKAAATSMVGQSFAWLNSPEAGIPLIVSVPVPLLVSLIDCAELVAPRRCPPKSRLLGLSLACGVGSGRASDQAPRPWVQATMEDASAVRVM